MRTLRGITRECVMGTGHVTPCHPWKQGLPPLLCRCCIRRALRLYHLVHLAAYVRKHCILVEGKTARKGQRCSYIAIASLLQVSAGAKETHGEWLTFPAFGGQYAVTDITPVCECTNYSCVGFSLASPHAGETRCPYTCADTQSHPDCAIGLVTS